MRQGLEGARSACDSTGGAADAVALQSPTARRGARKIRIRNPLNEVII